MRASTSGSRRSYLGPPPGDPVEGALKGASDLVAVQVWRGVAPLCVRLGEPRVHVGHAEWSALLVWLDSGGWIEVGSDEVRWFLVDPGAVLPPEEGGADRRVAAAALRDLAARWLAVAGGPPTQVDWERFLAFASRSLFRMEYVEGRVYAMAGGSPAHALVQQNLGGACWAGLRGTGCRSFGADLYILSVNSRDPGERRVRLPDGTIVCGPLVRDELDDRIVTNPTVLFEVLSPSNHAKDTQTNVAEYLQIPALQHFVVVDIATRRVSVHSRTATAWEMVEVPPGNLELPAVGLSLPLADIFEGVDDL